MRWPKGFLSAAASAGIKPNGHADLGVIVTQEPAVWAGTFTRNAAAAPSVGWSRGLLGKPVRAIVCNSGNANACTGAAGERAVRATAAAAGAAIGCETDEVLVASTGTIGVLLPVDGIVAAMPSLVSSLEPSPEAFAHSILTTDTTVKSAHARSGDASVVGVAKGAAMLAPNMATMLAFIATDAAVDDMQPLLSDAVEESFNRISIDACESTNDSVFLVASGKAPTSQAQLHKAVAAVCRSLAEQMVRDAEGGSRFVRIQVTGASDDNSAAELGRAIAASALWRAAVYGGDPNWGRVLSALGSADRSLDLGSVTIAIGSETMFDRGSPAGSLEAARKVMDSEEITLACVVGPGKGRAEILSSDLSEAYVALNARGST